MLCQPWRLAPEVLRMAVGRFLVQVDLFWLVSAVSVLRTKLLPLLHMVTAQQS
jgi:hypothetical protein